MENKVAVGFDNSGGVVFKNRAYRRRQITTTDMEGKPRSFYTTKQTKLRKKKNGKTVKIRKKSRK